MRRKSVPDEGDLVAVQVTVELSEELHQRFVVVGTGLHTEDEGCLGAVGPEAQSGRHGQALPVEAVAEDWGLPLGRPGGPHRGEEAEPALVLEDDPRVPGPSVFFTMGQRSLTQRSMASSSRSVALRAGRCRLQPIRRSTFHTCPGWYFTPVVSSITSATRARVHRSVGYPFAFGPFWRARSTLARSASVTLRGRPGCPVRFRACFPPTNHSLCQSETVWWETSSSRPMSAWDTPLENRSAARIRVASMASKSRRGRTRGGALFVFAAPAADVGVGMHQLFHSTEG